MKQFIIKTILIGGCVVFILAVLYFLVPIKPNNFFLAYKQKCELLETVPSPRIIFVGGSNLAFGLNSKKIQDSLHINVINYGLHAGIGLKYMLDDIASYIRKGDIIIFAPEYQHFYTIMYGESTTIVFIPKVGGWQKLHLFDRQQMTSLITGIPYYLQQTIVPQIITSKTYLASNFNQYGDEVRHWTLEDKYISHPKPIKTKFNNQFGLYFIKRLKVLQKQCSVYILPPSCCEKAFSMWAPQIEEISLFLAKEGFPFITSPKKFSFPENNMYDTDYHLNKQGVDIRTSLVIEALKPYVTEVTKK